MSPRGALFASALAVACAASGCASDLPPAATAGEGHYQAGCAACHGRKGQGLPALGAPLAGSELVRSSSDAELVAFLAEGLPADHPDNDRGVAMPARGLRGDLSDADLQEVVAFLRTLDGRPPAE